MSLVSLGPELNNEPGVTSSLRFLILLKSSQSKSFFCYIYTPFHFSAVHCHVEWAEINWDTYAQSAIVCTMFSLLLSLINYLWRGQLSRFTVLLAVLMMSWCIKEAVWAVPASMARFFRTPTWSMVSLTFLYLGFAFFKRFDDWFFMFQHRHQFFLVIFHQVISVLHHLIWQLYRQNATQQDKKLAVPVYQRLIF